MAVERVLTRRELNRALLARQQLLQRARLPLPRALERVGGLQAQYAPSMYVGSWSRVEGLQRHDLTRALERRTVVQATLMRLTIHLVSRADYWPLALATREARRGLWLRLRRDGLDAEQMEAAAATLRGELAAGPLRRREIEALLGKPRAGGVGLWLDLVRAPPSGTWERRRADLYALAEEWIGPPDSDGAQGLGSPDTPGDQRLGPPHAAAEQATELLVRRYLGGFGPASPADLADWAGLPAATLAPVLERLPLRRFRGESGAELIDLPRAPLPHPETPAPVRFLPTWDATLLVHARRTGILPEEYRPRIFHVRNPQSLATFLVDGAVAGAWRHEAGRIHLEPFHRLDGATLRAVREEADRLADFHG